MSRKQVPATLMSFTFRYRYKETTESEKWDFASSVQQAATIEEALRPFYEETNKKKRGYIEIENIEAEPVFREANFY